MEPCEIETGGLERADVVDLLTEHVADLRAISPRDSVHALDLAGPRAPGVTFWTARRDGRLGPS